MHCETLQEPGTVTLNPGLQLPQACFLAAGASAREAPKLGQPHGPCDDPRAPWGSRLRREKQK